MELPPKSLARTGGSRHQSRHGPLPTPTARPLPPRDRRGAACQAAAMVPLTLFGRYPYGRELQAGVDVCPNGFILPIGASQAPATHAFEVALQLRAAVDTIYRRGCFGGMRPGGGCCAVAVGGVAGGLWVGSARWRLRRASQGRQVCVDYGDEELDIDEEGADEEGGEGEGRGEEGEGHEGDRDEEEDWRDENGHYDGHDGG